MASIREKGRGHEIVFTDRSRSPNQVTIYYGEEYSKEEVEQLKRRLEEDYRWGLRDPWDLVKERYNPRIETAIKNYIDYKQNKTEEWKSEHTLKSNKATIKSFGQEYADLKLNDLSRKHIDKFINREDLAKATRESYLRDINAFLNWADVEIESPPIRGETQEKQTAYITEPEVQKVNETIIRSVHQQIENGSVTRSGPNSLWLVNLLSWSFYSGMRPSEILLLEHRDYDREEKVVHIRQNTKNSNPRPLPIGSVPILVQIMNTMTDPRVREKRSEDPYWKEDRIFGHYDVKNTSDKIKKYIRKAFSDDPERAEKLSWYSYRHGFAVWLLSSDPPVPIYSVSKLMGHSSVEVTENNYADIVPSQLGDQIGKAHN